MMMGFGYGGGFGGGLFGLVFLLGLVVFGVWAARNLAGHRGRNRPSPPSALEILKHRYAAGEINRDEYERMKHELTS